MNNFEFYSPTRFVFGKETENRVGELVKANGGSKVLIHYGGGSVKRSGLLDRVKASLDASGIAYCELGGVKASPLSPLVYEGIELAKKEGVDFVLAIGGGSVMDSGKAIALGAIHDGDFWEYYDGRTYRPVEKSLPVGVIVTIAASGSEGSTDSVVTLVTEDGHQYKRCADGQCLIPKFAILNPELLMTLPPYQTGSGISDMMAHCLERYFSDTKECEVTDRYLEALMITLVKEGRRCIEEPDNYDARANIMWTATIAQNNSTGVGRAQDWGTHHMENELGIKYGISHGEGLAILFPFWMEYARKLKGDELFVKFANRVFGVQIDWEHPENTAKEGIRQLRLFFDDLGMRKTIGECGGKKEDIPEMVENMFFGAPNHGNYVKLTKEIAAEIYEMAM